MPEGVLNTSDYIYNRPKTAPYILGVQYMEEKNNYNEGSAAIAKCVKPIAQRRQPLVHRVEEN
ncbi:hypothetical protein UN63_07090 [Oceanisphaera arctica]|uniref:Uncharacterized protein n=1 Tax=Oceanisphaera arctica TaxID=641510 RepID=A0A2P5TMY1_9GAMM|nr:hypothetical protein UN63_07090 [Oceanisphaera arctica]